MRSLFVLLLLSTTTMATNSFRLGVLGYRPVSVFAKVNQEEPKERFWDRVRFGGNLGLQFGNPTNVLISPSIGYIPKHKYLNDKLMLGLGVTYMYYRYKLTGGNLEANIYGGRMFARYLLTNAIFIYVENELLNAVDYYRSGERRWINSLFVGGGYLISFSQRGGIMISILYNLSWTPIHPIYASPWNVRIGFVL